jgi:MraZ protein
VFAGSFRHNLDTAGRFVMPQDMRNSLGTRFYITKRLNCLWVVTDEWIHDVKRELEFKGSKLAELLNPDISRLHYHFFSGLTEATTDKQNRVQLSSEHRRYAGIDETVVVCGCGNYIGLWSPDALAAYEKNNEQAEQLIESGQALLSPPAQGEDDAGVSPAGPSE